MMETILIAVILIVDQITKYFAAKLTASVEIIPNFLYFTFVKNEGAAWSMLTGHQVFLSLIAVVAIGVMLYFLMKARKQKLTLTRISLAMMMAGAAGNLIDRLALNYVRDFINTYIFGYDFPVFNIADCALTIGVAVLILAMILGEDLDKKKEMKE